MGSGAGISEFLIWVSPSGKDQPWWRRQETVDDWETFVEWLREDADGGKYARPYVAASFRNQTGGLKGRARRRKANLADRYAITLDADSAGDDYLERVAEVADWRRISHTTASHDPGGPKGARWRTVFPVSRPMTMEESETVATWLVEEIGRERFDVVASVSPVIPTYAPAWEGCEFEEVGGEILDVDEILMVAPAPAKKTRNVLPIEGEASPWEIEEALVIFEQQVARLQGSEEGERNRVLVSVASKLMMLVVGGCLDQDVVVDTLTMVAAEVGLEAEETRNALASAEEYAVADGGERPEAPSPGDVFEALDGHATDSEVSGCEWNECEGEKAAGSKWCADQAAARASDRDKEVAGEVVAYERHNLAADIHVARRIAVEYLDTRVRAFGKNGWGVWGGKIWDTEGGEDRIAGMVQAACLDIHRKEEARARRKMEKAEAEGDGNARKAYQARMKTVDRILMAGFLSSIQKMIRPYLSISPTMFDGPTTRHLLNCLNGVVNLRTGEVTEHRRDYYFTRITGAKYEEGAKHDDWETALTALPEEDATYLQRRLGQAVTGFPPSDDVVTFLGGGGENGKSTVVDSVHRALGGFFSFVPKDVIADNGRPKHDSLMFELKGVRLAVIEELPRNRWLDVEALKDIAGTNGLKARAMRETFYVHWTATHSVVVTSNYLIRVVETDWSVWRRLERVLFGFSFDGSDPDRPGDPGLRDRLREGDGGRAEAVLAWLVAGARRWFAEGLGRKDQPDRVKEETAKWRAAGNPIVTFANEYLEYDPLSASLSDDVYRMYRDWSMATGTKPVSDQVFWSRMEDTDLMSQPGVVKNRNRAGNWKVISTREIGERPNMLCSVRVKFEDLGYTGYLEVQGASD